MDCSDRAAMQSKVFNKIYYLIYRLLRAPVSFASRAQKKKDFVKKNDVLTWHKRKRKNAAMQPKVENKMY